MSLGIDTGVETPSEISHHTLGRSWCYLLDFFPNRRAQLNQIMWTMFVYFSFQIAQKEIARRKIGWPCGPRNIRPENECGMPAEQRLQSLQSWKRSLWRYEVVHQTTPSHCVSRANKRCAALQLSIFIDELSQQCNRHWSSPRTSGDPGQSDHQLRRPPADPAWVSRQQWRAVDGGWLRRRRRRRWSRLNTDTRRLVLQLTYLRLWQST